MRIADGQHLAAGVEMLGKSRHAGVRVRRDRRIMLIIIFEGYRIFCGGIPIDIGDGLIGGKKRGSGNNSILWKIHRRGIAVGGGDHVLAVG